MRFNNQEDLILSVVGNKIDLEEQREVQRQEAADYSLSIGASYHETSAKDNKGFFIYFLLFYLLLLFIIFIIIIIYFYFLYYY